MPVTSLHVTDVGPFDEVTVDFDPHVNVFTGPNNSGKSTLLWVLGELLVYPFTMPTKVLRSDQPKWILNITTESGVETIQGTLPARPEHLVTTQEKTGYTCYVPAQRQSTNFRSLGPSVSRGPHSQFDEYFELFAEERPDIIRRIGIEAFRQSMRHDPSEEAHPELAKRSKLLMTGNSLVTDKAVKQRIVDLDYASFRRQKPVIKSYLDQVALVVEEITEDFPIQFIGVKEDQQGLYPAFRTPDGDLPLDVLSQGTQSIIQFVAHLLLRYAEYYDFPPDLKDKPGIVLIDEIDAHLHPAWQRRIIPTLTRNFPNLQIFCSTHSPLMLAGLNPGQVHLMTRDENGRVQISRNDFSVAGWSADQILRNLLGVRNPTDLKAEETFDKLEKLSAKGRLNQEESAELERLTSLTEKQQGGGSASILMEKLIRGIREIQQEGTSREP